MSSSDDNHNKRPPKNPALVILALIVFVPFLFLSKLRGGLDSASDPAASGGGMSVALMGGILILVAVAALAASYLKK